MSSAKAKLIKNLKKETYCRISISKIPGAGVGVIAVKDIPKGVDPFKIPGGNNRKIHKHIKVKKSELGKIDKNVQKMIDDFIYKESDDSYYIPLMGLNSLDITFFMNHSKRPNMDIYDSGLHDNYMGFKTNKKIKKGSELTINYDKYE